VIWCEDHGDLAFYGGDTQDSAMISRLEPGDLVHFEIHQDSKLRLALNPRLVAADEYPTLMRDLRETGRGIATATSQKPNLCRIIPPAGDNPYQRQTSLGSASAGQGGNAGSGDLV